MNVTRRHLIGGLAGGLAEMYLSAIARSAPIESVPQRIVGLDRLAVQLLLSAGATPLATDVRNYVSFGAEAAAPLPSGVIDFGSKEEPNLELLQALKPDLLISTIAPKHALGRVVEIAPTIFLPIFGQSRSPLALVIEQTRHTGTLVGNGQVAAASIADVQTALTIAKDRLTTCPETSFLLVGLEPDGRHVTVYGKNSIMQDVAERIGMNNLWAGRMNNYGFISAGIEELIGYPASMLLYMNEGPLTDAALERLASSAFWTSLPFVKEGRLARLPTFDPLGALGTAKVFAMSASLLLAQNFESRKK